MDDAGKDMVHDDDQPQGLLLLIRNGSRNLQGLLLLIWNGTCVRLYLINPNSLGPAYNLLKGTCSSSVKLEYHFQECFNALTDGLDWNNPKGDRYPFDMSKPLSLQGHPERTYTMSIMKTKAARYEIEGNEDIVPRLWIPTKVGCNKDALKGIKHWGERRKLCYRS
ncbi:hypothetical protein Tco_0170342 [Tanacetum coccineum]